ncbi:alpha/beta fold hydrolase [Polycladidibacter stylochi]|uniref:alpha/beta fold hydrolase n=1 Tax=Polycladidibacter stylochi TaxID=1807766 RepID=UPI00138F553F|nr:alpha/beta hydrolase [Pseudovibrio stylochi]
MSQANAREAYRPYKDRLFAYPGILEVGYNGDYILVDYQIERDIYQRDYVAEQEVHSEYISLKPKWATRQVSMQLAGVHLDHRRVGQVTKKTRQIVFFLHGKGGDSRLGMSDYRFGGNFNRLKNLSYRNDGVYITADFTDFGNNGAAQVLELMQYYARKAPQANISLACASMGSLICYQMANNSQALQYLDAMIILGGANHRALYQSKLFEKRIPVVIAHGTNDRAYDWKQQFNHYAAFKKNNPAYPVRLTLFKNGSHGTPIRMIDWRLTLNWLSNAAPK